MQEKTVETYYGAANAQVYESPSRVYWLHIEAKTAGTIGNVDIYDGNSSNDPRAARITEAYGNTHSFYPPIKCNRAIYVAIDANVTSFTIGFIKEVNLEK